MVNSYSLIPWQNATISGPCFIKNIRVQSAGNYSYRIEYDIPSEGFGINVNGIDSLDFVYDLNWVVVDNASVRVINGGTTTLYVVITYEPIDGAKAGIFTYVDGGSQFDANFSEDAIVTSVFIDAPPQPITIVSPVTSYTFITEAYPVVITDINWPVSSNRGVSIMFNDSASYAALMYIKK